jgi:dUTPase
VLVRFEMPELEAAGILEATTRGQGGFGSTGR